ncbi:MAG: hypothetical protein AAB797_00915 [Patescibacteria group bacterium]
MFLIIDNTEEDKIVFSFWLNNKFVQRIFVLQRRVSMDATRRDFVKSKNKGILVCLEKLLSTLKLGLKDIKHLGVVVGVGRFTASRLGVTAANTLAFSLKIPVVALPKNFDQAYALKLAQSAVVGKYIMPTYSGEARIG